MWLHVCREAEDEHVGHAPPEIKDHVINQKKMNKDARLHNFDLREGKKAAEGWTGVNHGREEKNDLLGA